MNQEIIIKKMVQTMNKNKKLLKSISTKISKEQQSKNKKILEMQSQKQKFKSFKNEYNQLVKLSKQSILQNEKLTREIQTKNITIMQLQYEVRALDSNLRMKNSKFSNKLSLNQQSLVNTKRQNQLQCQNELLQKQICQMQKKLALQKQKNKQVQSRIQKLQQKQSQTKKQLQLAIKKSKQQQNSLRKQKQQIQQEIQIVKSKVFTMLSQVKRTTEAKTKRNKVQALTDIKSLIRKHRESHFQ